MPNSTPPQPRPPKTMSSRLMTMKFMQRAAASSSPSTPQSQSEEAQPPPSKRQRTSQTDDTADSRTNEISTIQIVLDEEEQRRVNAVDKLAEDAGETKWVLSTVNEGMDENQQQLRVATAGYSDIDEGVWRPAGSARRSFGRFNRDLEKPENGTSDGSSSDSEDAPQSGDNDDNSGEHSDDPAGTRDLIRAVKEKATNRERLERKQRKRANKAELARLAEKRRKKEVKLNGLSSISGVNGSGGKAGGGKGDRECYQCGEKGHERRDCPRKDRRKNDNSSSGTMNRSKKSLNY